MAVKDQCLWFSSSKEQSQESPLAPLALMEKPSDSIIKGHVKNGEFNSRIGCSAFTMFPTIQSTINKRALGQASRYMNANARKQSEQDIGRRTRGRKSWVSSASGPDCGSKSLKPEPVDEDGTIADSMPKEAVPLVSCEQPKEIYLPELEEEDSERLWTINPKEPVRKGTSSHQEYCLKPLSEYFTKDCTFKTLRDHHVPSLPNNYSCTKICEFCGFMNVCCLKDHIMFMHFWGQDGSTSACKMCNRSGLDPERLFNHIEGCMF